MAGLGEGSPRDAEPAAASEQLVSIRRGAEIFHMFIELYRIIKEPSLCYTRATDCLNDK